MNKKGLLIAAFGVMLWLGLQWKPGSIVVPFVPTTPDVLDVCHKADRDSQIRILNTVIATEFKSDVELGEWINAERSKARTEDWKPYTSALGKAIDAGKLKEFVESIR